MDLRKLFGLLATLAVVAAGCTTEKEEETDSASANRAVNRWIYGIMEEQYLWNDELPTPSNYTIEYDRFFKELLSDNDGKHTETVDYYYSYMYKIQYAKTTRADEDYYRSTFGFDYILTQTFLHDPLIVGEQASPKLYATIAYVTPGSAADSARLTRGDHIYKVAGKEITFDNYRTQIASLTAASQGYSSVTFTTCQLDFYSDAKGTLTSGEVVDTYIVTRDSENDRTVTLVSSEMDQSPIGYTTVIDTTGGKKIGYLLYNEFERGGSGRYYDQQLTETFRDFSGAGITDLVLDLRYNPGGYVSSCQLLASLIVPTSLTGSVFQYQEKNDGTKDAVLYTSQPASVRLRRVYILASSYSASASEALIHGLRASGIEVYHIGSTTEGKNVGQTEYNTETLQGQQKQDLGGANYLAYPVTFRILDCNENSYSSDGLLADYVVYEDYMYKLMPLGDPDEPLLRAAVNHILTGNFPASTRSGAAGNVPQAGGMKPVRNVKPAMGYLEIP